MEEPSGFHPSRLTSHPSPSSIAQVGVRSSRDNLSPEWIARFQPPSRLPPLFLHPLLVGPCARLRLGEASRTSPTGFSHTRRYHGTLCTLFPSPPRDHANVHTGQAPVPSVPYLYLSRESMSGAGVARWKQKYPQGRLISPDGQRVTTLIVSV